MKKLLLVNIFYLVGKKNGNPKPKIILSSLGIQPLHAVFYNIDDIIYLEPYNERYNY